MNTKHGCAEFCDFAETSVMEQETHGIKWDIRKQGLTVSNTNRINFQCQQTKKQTVLNPLPTGHSPPKNIYFQKNIRVYIPDTASVQTHTPSICWALYVHGKLLFTSHSLAGSYNLNMAAIIWHYLAPATNTKKIKRVIWPSVICSLPSIAPAKPILRPFLNHNLQQVQKEHSAVRPCMKECNPSLEIAFFYDSISREKWNRSGVGWALFLTEIFFFQ